MDQAALRGGTSAVADARASDSASAPPAEAAFVDIDRGCGILITASVTTCVAFATKSERRQESASVIPSGCNGAQALEQKI